MNKWQQIWERRRDNLQHIDTNDTRAVFAELIRLDGYDSAGLTTELVDYMAHQYDDLKAALIDIAARVLPAENVRELICAGAEDLPTDEKYDATFATSVFSYFDDVAYAERVLEKMLSKSLHTVAVLDIYDKDFEAELLAERRRIIENYDERYRGLSKLFLPRNFFEDFAARYALKIHFADNKREGYVNAPYTYHCFMERS